LLNEERKARDVLVIGASAGGVEALRWIVGHLPGDLPATVILVLHRSPMFESRLPQVLGRNAKLECKEPEEGAPVAKGVVFVAPRDLHLTIADDHTFHLDRGPKQHHTRPAVDPLFVSAATVCGERVVGVLLTGNGDDGVSGLIAIKKAHGLSLVQDPQEASFSSMPRSALLYDNVDRKMPLHDMPGVLEKLARGEPA
jgi:two-component system chemotaxis response regulator CheB